jgi:predicted DNA-binding transcriptional regulator YafY
MCLSRLERRCVLVIACRRHPYTSADLAAHFGVTRRTIFADVAALRAAGVPITTTGDGYRVPSGYELRNVEIYR